VNFSLTVSNVSTQKNGTSVMHVQVLNGGSSAERRPSGSSRSNAEELTLDVSRVAVGLEALKVQTTLNTVDQLTALGVEVDFDCGQQNGNGLANRFDVASVLHREGQRAFTDFDVVG
jgi:hypothetical protein